MAENTILVSAIVASKTNPRKNFDKAALQELAESLAKHGMLQPVLVRPNGSDGTYELVAGERRWRAAKIAKLDRIPATVRELTDAEVLEIQVVENLQRADLHPLEEAEGYEALMKCQHADGHTYTAEEIAGKVGKSKSYVYQRLKLTALTPKAREAFYDGRLDASRALLVARVPAALQDEVLDRLAPGEDDGWVPSFREARDIIHDDFMLGLKDPPFDVKAIYFAGDQANPIGVPCGECPKRTGNQPELFDDVKSADVCTDPACFRAKAAAHVERLAEEHRAKGLAVLTGPAARKVLKHSWSQPAGGFMGLDAILPGAPKRKSVKQLLGKKMPPVTLVEHPDRQRGFVEVVSVKAVQEALLAAGHDWVKSPTQAFTPGDPRAAGRSLSAQRREQSLKEAGELALHKAVREAVGRDGLDEQDLRAIVRLLGQDIYPDEDIAKLSELPDDSTDTEVPKAWLIPMLVDLALPYRYSSTERAAMAQRHGIDVEAVTAQGRAEFEAREGEEQATQEKPKKAKKAKAEETEA